MPKRLVLCCDGTWNTPDQRRGGRHSPTNVVKFARALAPEGLDGLEQRVFYQCGVGTAPWERLRGGAFGFGLSRDVREVYRYLAQTYEPGDELFFVGFSRGAYTARSAVGLVRNCGVLRPEYADRVGAAYRLYRSRADRTHPKSTEAALFRRTYSREPRIRFVGVWDTVGSLGIPLSGMRLINLLNRRWQFHDLRLSGAVDDAFQAVAIDEKRRPFRPTLWTAPEQGGQGRREQVWFAGVHSDVGGGYAEPALADIALLWLADRARDCGLAFDDAVLAEAAPDPGGALHESRTGLYRLLPALSRTIAHADPGHEYVASGALERREQQAYAPGNLERLLEGTHQVAKVRTHS